MLQNNCKRKRRKKAKGPRLPHTNILVKACTLKFTIHKLGSYLNFNYILKQDRNIYIYIYIYIYRERERERELCLDWDRDR